MVIKPGAREILSVLRVLLDKMYVSYPSQNETENGC